MCSAIDTRITGKLKTAIGLTAVTLLAEVGGAFFVLAALFAVPAFAGP